MDIHVKIIADKVDALAKDTDILFNLLEECGWKYSQPSRVEEKFENTDVRMASFLKNLETTPEIRKISDGFLDAYQNWYTAILVLLDQHLSERKKDFVSFHSGDESTGSINLILKENYMSFRDQQLIVGNLRHMRSILKTLPTYLETKIYNLERLLTSDMLKDEIQEARELLKSKYARAAGALAGVALERHLKFLCKNNGITHNSNHGIANLNDLLKSRAVYDDIQHRKIDFLRLLRNKCDHPSSVEPTEAEITDLVDGVESFIKMYPG